MENYYPSPLNWIVLVALAMLLTFATFAFGSVHVWAYSAMAIAIFVFILIWFFDHVILRSPDHLTLVRTPVDLMLILFVVIIGLQLVPLPSFVVALLSPQTYQDKKEAFDMLAGAKEISGKQNWMAFSYYIHPTRLEGIKVVAYLGTFFLVINTLRDRKHINFLIYVLIIIGSIEAVYGIFQSVTRNPKVLWWIGQRAQFIYASGTFVGSNHFAFYLEMVLPLTMGFVLSQRSRKQRLASGLGGTRAFVQKMVDIVSPESANPKRFLLGFCAVIMGVAMILSASRSGIISLSISTCIVIILFLTNRRIRKSGFLASRRIRKSGIVVLCFFITVFLLALYLGMVPTIDKFEGTDEFGRRIYTTKTLLPILRDYPLLGVGWGNLKHIYPKYIPSDAPGNFNGLAAAGYAHNDWVEAGTDAGFAGGLLILLIFGLYGYRMIRIWRRRNDIYAIGIGAGVLVGLGACGIHSFFDFSMHIPANPITFAAITGIGYAALHGRSHGYQESFFYKTYTIPLNLMKRILIVGTVLLVFSVFSITIARHMLAENICPTEWNSTIELNRRPTPSTILEAMGYNPKNSEYPYKMALHHIVAYAENKTNRREANEKSIQYLEKTIRLNPTSGKAWFQLGGRYVYRKYDSYEYITRWLPLAEHCFEMAMRYSPRDSKKLFYIGSYWLWRSSVLALNDINKKDESGTDIISPTEQTKEKFQSIFRQALILDPEAWEKVVDEIWSYYPDDGTIMRCIPIDNQTLKSNVIKYIATKS